MSKKSVRDIKEGNVVKIGYVNNCPKCKEKMERRKRIKIPSNKTYFYTEWDVCTKCKHVQHYDQYKSPIWREDDMRKNVMRSIQLSTTSPHKERVIE